MTTRNFTEETDNIKSRITKEDRVNTDILELFDIPESTAINIGDTVNYYDVDSTLLFSGIVQERDIGAVKSAIVFDKGAQLLQRDVNEIKTSISPEDLFEYVINNYSDLTFVSTISSGVTIPEYDARNKKAWDICQDMADILLANFRVDKNGNIYLEIQGDSFSSKTIDTTNWVLKGNWKEDKTKLINSIKVEAEDLIQEKSESFAGPGTTFSLSFIPIDMLGVTVGGSAKTGYVEGTSTGDYKIKKSTKDIIFDSSSSTVIVNYTYRIPINPRRRNLASITTYGQHDRTIHLPYIVTRDEARDYCNYIITNYRDPLKNSDWISKNKDDYDDFESFVPNNRIPVDDAIYSITDNFIISKVVREYPGTLTVTVGDKSKDMFFYQKELEKRIKQLEEKSSNTELVNEDELIEETADVSITVSISAYQKRGLSDAFYLSETDIANAHMSETDNNITMYEEANLPAWSDV